MKQESIPVRITACRLMSQVGLRNPRISPLRNDVLYWSVHTHLFNALFKFYCSDVQYYSPDEIVIK